MPAFLAKRLAHVQRGDSLIKHLRVCVIWKTINMCVHYTCTMYNNYKSNIMSFEELSPVFTYFYVSLSVSMYVVFECVLQFMCQLHAPTLLCHLCSWHGSLVSVMKRNAPSSSLFVVSLSVSLTIPSSLNIVSLTSTDSAALRASCLQADTHKITNNWPFPGISALETPEMHLLKSNLLDLLLIFFFFFKLSLTACCLLSSKGWMLSTHPN